MSCAACGDPSLTGEFCGTCWKVCPDPTKRAFLSGEASVKRVAEAINLRRMSASQVHAGDRMRRSGSETFANPRYARSGWRKR